MKKMRIILSGLMLTCLVVVGSSHATLIKVNGIDVEVLDLNGTSPSFTTFYNYTNFGANTGYEQSNVAVLFLAELNNEIALITTVNKDGAGDAGKLNLTFSGTDGGMLFVDDASEITGNQITWSWATAKADGAIYSGLTSGAAWELNFDFEALKGITAFTFLTEFDNNGGVSDSISGSFPEVSFNIVASASPVTVPNPSSIFLLGLGLLMLARRKLVK